MILRGFRRSIKSKYILIGLVVICVLFYIKFVSHHSAAGHHSVDLKNIHIDSERRLAEAAALNSDSDQRFEKLIQLDIAKQVHQLGDRGKAVTLTGYAKEIGDKKLKSIALNEELSEHLSYNRTTPDARNPLCKNVLYDLDELGTASVVVIFYNEPYSVLVRTVHSAINSCPGKILKEVILVDDCSTNVELKDKLDYYIATRFEKDLVKTIRLKSRLVTL